MYTREGAGHALALETALGVSSFAASSSKGASGRGRGCTRAEEAAALDEGAPLAGAPLAGLLCTRVQRVGSVRPLAASLRAAPSPPGIVALPRGVANKKKNNLRIYARQLRRKERRKKKGPLRNNRKKTGAKCGLIEMWKRTNRAFIIVEFYSVKIWRRSFPQRASARAGARARWRV